MYYDNAKIADIHSANLERKNNKFLKIQANYINDLWVLEVDWIFSDNAFDEVGEFVPEVMDILINIDDAVNAANKTIDPDMEVDSDYLLTMIQTDNAISVLGMTTDTGVDYIEDAISDAANFGTVKFHIK